MPIERHHALVTVAGVQQWKNDGTPFKCRYDLVRAGKNNVTPTFNCIYLQGGEEFILVSSSARPDGGVQERKMQLWPGILQRHHSIYGDGSMVVFNPSDQTISTWIEVEAGKAVLSTEGKIIPESDET